MIQWPGQRTAFGLALAARGEGPTGNPVRCTALLLLLYVQGEYLYGQLIVGTGFWYAHQNQPQVEDSPKHKLFGDLRCAFNQDIYVTCI